MILCPGKASPPLERPVSMSLLLFRIRYPYIYIIADVARIPR